LSWRMVSTSSPCSRSYWNESAVRRVSERMQAQHPCTNMGSAQEGGTRLSQADSNARLRTAMPFPARKTPGGSAPVKLHASTADARVLTIPPPLERTRPLSARTRVRVLPCTCFTATAPSSSTLPEMLPPSTFPGADLQPRTALGAVTRNAEQPATDRIADRANVARPLAADIRLEDRRPPMCSSLLDQSHQSTLGHFSS